MSFSSAKNTFIGRIVFQDEFKCTRTNGLVLIDVSKVLVPGTDSPLTKRKALRALGSVSALIPIRDDCLYVIHKSVKDWLADNVSCYGEHKFIVDENQGHCILAALCTDELSENLKRKGVHNI